MKILVTGSEGLIGVPVVKKLKEAGHVVQGYDKKTDPLQNIHNEESLMDATKDKDVVVHLAGIPHPQGPATPFPSYVRTNIDGTRNVLKASIEMDVKRFIYSSSSAIYGYVFKEGEFTLDRMPPDWHWFYLLSKIGAELVITEGSKQSKIEVAILRVYPVNEEWLFHSGVDVVAEKVLSVAEAPEVRGVLIEDVKI